MGRYACSPEQILGKLCRPGPMIFREIRTELGAEVGRETRIFRSFRLNSFWAQTENRQATTAVLLTADHVKNND